jgi:hypothetical protein
MWRGVFIFSMFVSLGLVATTWLLSWRLAGPRNKTIHRWLLRWSIKGLLLPLLLWFLMNIGLSLSLQPFMPQIQLAQNSGGRWLPSFMRVMAAGLFLISSYWAAVTLTWRLWLTAASLDEEGRADFKALCRTCVIAMSVPAIVIVLLGGWAAIGLGATAIVAVAAGWAHSIVERSKTPPIYSRALARMNFGKYAEAELEIIKELEKCEDDFDGWMMMADLYANQFKDLGEAQNTIAELCEHPNTTPSQFSIALHRLADWHLKLADDYEGARRALQVICDRLRGTHLARMAQLRINQLPRSVEEARERRNAAPIPLPALGSVLDDETSAGAPELSGHQARELAQEYVERLKRDPNDVAVREKFARLIAEHLDRADVGIEQLSLLLDVPNQPDSKRAHWLSLIAAWHIKYRQDLDRGRKMLDRLIDEFPGTPEALAARRRIELLDRDVSST